MAQSNGYGHGRWAALGLEALGLSEPLELLESASWESIKWMAAYGFP